MSPIHAITPVKLPLSPLAEKISAALRQLKAHRQPHPCGGFNIDDMRWQMGRVFEPDDTIHEAIQELIDAKLIRFAGFDDEAAEGTTCTFAVIAVLLGIRAMRR